jgi:hypothetical protein
MRVSCVLALCVSLAAVTPGRAEIIKGVLAITGAEMK